MIPRIRAVYDPIGSTTSIPQHDHVYASSLQPEDVDNVELLPMRLRSTSAPQGPEKSGRPLRSCLAILYNSWLAEILASITSAGALIALIVLLGYCDNGQQPHWHHVSLNAVVSLLSTVAKACVALVLSSALGQLKWVWFQKREHTLADLDMFDAASRGPLGSVYLLWSQRMQHLASIGAIAMILSLAIDPFVQNLLHYSPKPVSDRTRPALVSNVSYYSSLGPLLGGSHFLVNPVLKSNVYSSLLDVSPEQTWAIPQYLCPTSNCTWDPFLTLTVQSACTNVTPMIDFSLNSSTEGAASLPNGLSVTWRTDIGAVPLNMTTSNKPIVPRMFYGSNSPLTYVQYIAAVGNETSMGASSLSVSSNSTFVAMDCALYGCIANISAAVKQSIYQASNEPMNPNNTAGGRATLQCLSLQGGPSGPSLTAGISTSYQGTTFGIDSFTGEALENFFDSLFTGRVYGFSDVFEFDAKNDASAPGAPDVIQSIYYGNISGCTDGLDHLDCAMRNVAKALTKSFRDDPFIQMGGYEGANMTLGHTLIEQIHVHIEWAWLSIPILVWIMALALWVMAVLQTRSHRVPLWRNDPLPLLYLYRGSDPQGAESGGSLSTSYKQLAETVRVQLSGPDGDIQLRKAR